MLCSAHADMESVPIALVRGPGSYGIVSAQLTTSDLTARLGVDYFTGPQPVSVWFPDSVVSATVNISLTNDGLVHPAKQFTLHLTGTTGMTHVAAAAAALIVLTSLPTFNRLSWFRRLLKTD